MTVFDLDEQPGVWFDLEGGGRVRIRSMSPETLKAIRKQAVKKRIEYKRVDGKAERFEVEEVNEDLQNELFWDHVIVDWQNFFDRNSQPIPCTRENKVLLLSRSAMFGRVLADALKQVSEDEAGQAEAAEKN